MLSTFLGSGRDSRKIAAPVQADDEYWDAVERRDPTYFAKFVYGVKSTGIFCRPTCSSRRPDRKQVQFFENSELALAAGFRGCLRCKPEIAAATFRNREIDAVETVCRYIEENYESKLLLSSLAELTGYSPFHLQKLCKRILGVSPREYQEKIRLQRLKLGLSSGETVRKATYSAGYNSSGWLYSHGQSDSKLGMSAGKYKDGGEGIHISYAIVGCELGWLLVAATSQGICAVSLGDSTRKLYDFLRKEFPKATLDSNLEETRELAGWISKIRDYIEKGTDLSQEKLPLDIRASAFQSRVWKELQRIPYGAVMTYSEVAQRAGVPRGARAVAKACATNPVALVIPCHRVVRKNGDYGGYRWGRERKERLLEKEREYKSNLTQRKNRA